MKKFTVTVIASLTLAFPMSAFAATVDVQSQILFLLGQVAALTARISQSSVVCAVASDKATVKVGETYHIIWSSFGAIEPSAASTSVFAPSGIGEFVAQKPGTMKYTLSVFSPQGDESKCSASFRVLPQ